MLSCTTEELLLLRTVTTRRLQYADVAAASSAEPAAETVVKWGQVIERLLAAG
jgi:hypothetical protein